MTTSKRVSLQFYVPFLAGLIALLLVPGGAPQAAHAATITVTTTNDELNSDGDCSLREAISGANADAVVDACTAGSGADTINVPSGTYNLTINNVGENANAGGDLDITSDVTIAPTGSSPVVIANQVTADRVLHVVSGTAALTISDVTIRGGAGSASANGGGINNAGTLTISESTLRNNLAGARGGGLYNATGGLAIVTNVTMSANTALLGGGIYNDGTLFLASSTVTANGWLMPNPGAEGGGISNASSATVKNTIVANNINAAAGPDCQGTISSVGYNLIESTSGCAIAGTTTGNITGVDPNLGPLQNNGGPTDTHALLTGSVAIEAGSPDCPPPATDQRGFLRPQGPECDIGAFELESVGGITDFSDAREVVVLGGSGFGRTKALALVALVSALGATGWYARRRMAR